MSGQVVQYELSLKDGLSEKVDGAARHVKKLESNLGELGERIAHVAEAFGISFAIFKGGEFIHEGIEEMEKMHKAEAALQNTMENMGTYTEEAFEKGVKGAEELSRNLNYTKADILGLQSQLGLVGNIGEEEMGRITKASADLATKMGTGLEEAGNLLAKAINAPEMARRLGMALKIDPGVMEHIQNLAKHGKEAQARLELLAITEAKVGGAAEAAFNADPMARFNKTMLEVKESVGALAIDFLKTLTPALEWVSSMFKYTATWMKQHKELLGDIGRTLIILGSAYLVYKGILLGLVAAEKLNSFWELVQVAAMVQANAMQGELSIGMTILTAVQYGLNAAMEANPIGFFIGLIAAATAAVVFMWKEWEGFRAFLFAMWGVIKEFGRIVADVFTGLWHVIHGVFTFNGSEIIKGAEQGVSAMADAGKRMASAYMEGWDEGKKNFNEDHEKKESLIPKRVTGKGGATIEKPSKEVKSKATGSKSVTVNVSIQKLGETHISVTNIKEGMQSLREGIIKTLSGAVNDFQIVADH